MIQCSWDGNKIHSGKNMRSKIYFCYFCFFGRGGILNTTYGHWSVLNTIERSILILLSEGCIACVDLNDKLAKKLK